MNGSTRKYVDRKCLSCSTNCEVRARGVVVIVVGNGHGDTSSNPGRD